MDKGTLCYTQLTKALKLMNMSKNSKISLLRENCKSLEVQLSSIKETNKSRIMNLEEGLEVLELEKDSIEKRLEMQSKEMKDTIKEKELAQEEELNRLRTRLDKVETKAREERERLRNTEEEMKCQVSEKDTEVILLKQRVQFWEKEGAEWKEEKQKLFLHQKMQEESGNGEMLKVTQNYEDTIRRLNKQVKKAKEDFREYKDEITQQSILQESMCKEWGTKEDELGHLLEQVQRELRESKKREDKAGEQTSNLQAELEELRQLNQRTKEMKSNFLGKFEDAEAQIVEIRKQNSKEEAIRNQKEQFVLEERDQLKDQLKELKRVHERMISAMKVQRGHKEESSTVREGCEEVLKQMEQKMLLMKEQRTQQEERFRLEIRAVRKEKEMMEEEMNQRKKNEDDSYLKVEELKGETLRLKKLIEQVEAQKTRIVTETVTLWREKFEQIESELQMEKQKRDKIIRAEKEEIEGRVKEMKEFFQGERERLELKAKQEKDWGDKRIKDFVEELEERLESERNEREEEAETFEEKLREAEEFGIFWKDRAESLEKDWSSKMETEKLAREKEVGEIRGQLALENQRADKGEESLLKRREESRIQFEELKKDLIAKNGELNQLKQKNELMKDKIQREKSQRESRETRRIEEEEGLVRRLEELKAEKVRLAEELIKMKVEIVKEMALSQQKQEFREKRMSELAETNDTLKRILEENDQKSKRLLEDKLENLKKGFEEDIESLENRYQEKRKAMKNLEIGSQAKIMELEKQKIGLEEKVKSLKERVRETEQKARNDAEQGMRQLGRLKENIKKEREASGEELAGQRVKAYDAEIALAETLARLDKEEALWKGRVEFLEQQRKQLKLDLSETQKNFDMMIGKLQQYRSEEKDEKEETLARQIQDTEKRYKQQIQAMGYKFEQREIALSERIELLESEIGRLERVNQETINKRFTNRLNDEKKLNQLLEKEKILQDEIMMLKCEKDSIGLIYQRELEKERERWKAQMFEMECLTKKTENEKNLMIFEHEKQRTKWMIEKDNLIFQKQDNHETVEKLQRQKDHLTKENERLKGNIKVLKKSNLGHSIMSFAKSRYMITPKKH